MAHSTPSMAHSTPSMAHSTASPIPPETFPFAKMAISDLNALFPGAKYPTAFDATSSIEDFVDFYLARENLPFSDMASADISAIFSGGIVEDSAAILASSDTEDGTETPLAACISSLPMNNHFLKITADNATTLLAPDTAQSDNAVISEEEAVDNSGETEISGFSTLSIQDVVICNTEDSNLFPTCDNTGDSSLPSTLSNEDTVSNDRTVAVSSRPKKASILGIENEIQNAIFELAYIQRDPITEEKVPIYIDSLVHGQRIFFRPLLTNKSLNQQLRPVIFGQNIFSLAQLHEKGLAAAGSISPAVYLDVRGHGALDYPRRYTMRQARMAEASSKGQFSVVRYGTHHRTGATYPSNFGLLLPPRQWCGMMKNLRIVIEPPPFDRTHLDGYSSAHIPWLNILTMLGTYRFSGLELLQVAVPIVRDVEMSLTGGGTAWVGPFKDFVRTFVAGIQPPPAKKVEITFFNPS